MTRQIQSYFQEWGMSDTFELAIYVHLSDNRIDKTVLSKAVIFLTSTGFKFCIFLTVHLRIILVGDQLDAQFLL